jgi:outer membrane protein assembly factor BamB
MPSITSPPPAVAKPAPPAPVASIPPPASAVSAAARAESPPARETTAATDAQRRAVERAKADREAAERAAKERAEAKRKAAQREAAEREAAAKAATKRQAAEREAAKQTAAQRAAAKQEAAEREAAERAAAARIAAHRAEAEREAAELAQQRAAAADRAKATRRDPADRAPAAAAPRYVESGRKTPAAHGKSDKPGGIVWRFPELLPGQGDVPRALRNCPVVDEKNRIFAAIGRELVALIEKQGELKAIWRYPTGGQIPGSPTMGRDGRLRVHSSDGQLHCIDTDGEQAWASVDVGEPLGWASPVVDADANTFVSAYSGGLVKVDARGTKQNAPYFRSRQKFDSTALIHQSVLYIGAEDSFVYAIELEGTRSKNRWDHAADRGKTEWFINSSPALTPDASALIVAGRDEFLYSFDLNGVELWTLHIRGQMLASPVIDVDGNIYVGVSLIRRGEPAQGKLICVDGHSHRVRWEYRAQGPVECTPVIGSDGIIYFGDNSGTVHAVDAEGQAVWTQDAGSPVRSAGTFAGPKRVAFGLDDGTLVALVCTSEQLAAGGWPKYMGTLGQSGSR